MKMNNEEIVNNMVSFIENIEKEQVSAKVGETRSSRNEIVNKILAKLDEEIGDEN